MKKDLASIELKFLVEELQVLLDARIDQIFQPQTKEVLLIFHKSGEGKLMLRILPNFMFLTRSKGENPQSPPKFCTILRKHLSGARIASIAQLGAERIVDIVLASKNASYHLFIELFSKGNIILTDDKLKIISPLDNQDWKDRIIRRGETYSYPKRDFNIFDAGLNQFEQAIKKSDRDIVKALAMDIGLGGLYAEEVLALSNIRKDKKVLLDKELKDIFSSIQKILKSKPKGFIYRGKNENESEILNITPIEVSGYNNPEKLPSFNEALDSILSAHIEEEKSNVVKSKYSKKLNKYEVIIKTQNAQIKALESESEESQKKADLIYEKYQLINDILTQLKEAQKSHSLQDIKKKLKDHKIIKDVDPKDKSIVVEL